jgi:hypothetical protein
MNTREMALHLGALVGLSGLLTSGGWLRVAVAPQMQAPVALTRADRERLERTASASLFGELRGGMADYLWMKAERLLHNGVETRALTDAEKQDARRWHSQEAHGQETPVARNEEEETTVVPNREADHRGILGDLERQIKPYMDMRNHTHRDPGDTAALFRMMTWANPHFIPGWVVGANVLAEDLKRPKDALTFLREGVVQNPDSLELQAEIGRYLLYKYHDAPGAEKCFRQAIALGAAQRSMPEDQTEAWENAHRWLVIQYHNLGRQREAREIALLATRRFPQSGYFRKALQRSEAGEQKAS